MAILYTLDTVLEKFVCKQCNKKYRSMGLFNRHILEKRCKPQEPKKTRKKVERERIEKPTKIKELKPKRKKKILKIPKKRSQKIKVFETSFSCPFEKCEKVFSKKRYFDEHFKRHGEKLFKCEVECRVGSELKKCEKDFYTASEVYRHWNFHLKNQCQVCEIFFMDRHALAKHNKEKHSKKVLTREVVCCVEIPYQGRNLTIN